MQGCSQHLPAHDHGTHNGYTDMVSDMKMMMLVLSWGRFFMLPSLISVFFREQLLQVLLRVTEAVMKRPQENQKRDMFAQSLASILFRVCPYVKKLEI